MTITRLRIKPYLFLAGLMLAAAIFLATATPALATHSQDFSIQKTANLEEVALGDNVTFTLQVSNTVSSSSSASGAQVTDQLPAELELVSFRVVQQPQRSNPFTCSATGNTVICTSSMFGGHFGSTDTATIEVVAKRVGSGDTTNTATIQPRFGSDYNRANNTSSVTVAEAPLVPTSKEECKNGGYTRFADFKNQGDCVSFVATGGKNEPGKNVK